jgi:N-succinyldiaminopimelate aminotransferase
MFYTEKFRAVLDILQPVIDVQMPAASFYIWLKTPICEQEFAKQLFATQNVTVLPGSYLSRENNGLNPGAQHVRMALVAPLDECIEAAKRIKQFIESLI